MMRASSLRARCGAAAAMTASCSIRRSSAAGRTGEVWRLEENLAPLACRLPQAPRREQPLPRAYRLRRSHVGARDRRAGAADACATSAERLRWAKWPCARKHADCCFQPRSSRAGLRTKSSQRGSPRRPRTARRPSGEARPPLRAAARQAAVGACCRTEDQQRHGQRQKQQVRPVPQRAAGRP